MVFFFMFESLNLVDLKDLQGCKVLRQHSSTRPEIFLVKHDGVQLIVKNFSRNKFLFRNTIGRFLVWRESKAYRKLGALKGIPRMYKVVDGLALLIEAIQGRTLEHITEKKDLPLDFFPMLRNLISECHKRGQAHCDIKKSANIIFGNDNLPYIIDWGASINIRECSCFPLSCFFNLFVIDDYKAITKLKLRLDPESVGFEEKKWYFKHYFMENHIRTIRDGLRALLKKIA